MSDLLPFNERMFDAQLAELDHWRTRLDTAGSLVMSWDGRLRRDLEAAAVAASTSMEGVPVTVHEVRQILAGDRPASVSVEDASLVSGYRDAMRYVQRRADDPSFAWSSELIKGIHDRVLAGSYPKGAGRYGAGRWVENSQSAEVIFMPPPEEDVPHLVDQACERMTTWQGHPALRSAWIHIAIAAIHPFKDGNGRTARVLSSLGMYRGGFKRPEFCSLEEWWGKYRSTYYDAFKCLGRQFDRSSDVTAFVAAHVAAQVSQVRALDLRQQVDRRIWLGLEAVCEKKALPRRAANALWDAFYGRDIRPLYYRKLADVGEATSANDLRGMRGAGLLESLGQTRARRYIGTDELFLELARVLSVPDQNANREGIIAQLTRYGPGDRMIFASDFATGSEDAHIVATGGSTFTFSASATATTSGRTSE